MESFKLNLADIEMGRQMFEASPDGQAEAERVRQLIEALPDATIEVNFSEDDRHG